MSKPILEHIGYYKVKKTIKQLFFKWKILLEDYSKRTATAKAIKALTDNLLSPMNNNTDIIVSLTSYGDRVVKTLPFTLYSLLTQTLLPGRIVCWLDQQNWNNDNLPHILKKLQRAGVDFCYTDDLRSYKKLIPALKQYPNNVIITVDDDMYYNSHTIEWLVDAYLKSDKQTVIGTFGRMESSVNGTYVPYNQWITPPQKDGGLR